MKHSTDRILTTHAGSLSRPADLIALNRARAQGEKVDDGTYARCLAGAVTGVVRKQRELGVDIPDDGEFGKPMAANYDYGVWWNYAFARMQGFVPADSVPESAFTSGRGHAIRAADPSRFERARLEATLAERRRALVDLTARVEALRESNGW